MLEFKIVDKKVDGEVVKMSEMKTMQVAVVVEGGKFEGDTVMRTQSDDFPEVINLSNPRHACGWSTGLPDMKVELLPAGKQINLTIFNED